MAPGPSARVRGLRAFRKRTPPAFRALNTLERVLSIRNAVGLLSELYDPESRRLLGNFPQAFSHVGLVNTALSLRAGGAGPASARGQH